MPKRRPDRLPVHKRIRRSLRRLGHNRRRREDADQSKQHQQQHRPKQPLIDADALCHSLPYSSRAHKLLEDAATMLVVLKLVEAGARRREQHHVARLRLFLRPGDRPLHRSSSLYLHDTGELRLDLFRCRTNGDNRLHPRAQQRRQRAIVRVLVLAAENQPDAARKGLDRLRRRIDIGRLGVVEPAHAVNLAHELQAVLDGMKRCDSLADRLSINASETRCADRREHVLHVVRARERNLGDRHDWLHLATLLRAEEDALAVHERALLHLPARTEPVDLSLRLRGDQLRGLVFGVEDQEVVCGLVLGDASLRRGVGLEAAVAVEVIRCDVQHQRDLRMECLNRLQLEARDLEHTPALRSAIRRPCRRPDGRCCRPPASACRWPSGSRRSASSLWSCRSIR